MNNYILGAFTLGVLTHELSPTVSYVSLIGCYAYNLNILTPQTMLATLSKYYEFKARVSASIEQVAEKHRKEQTTSNEIPVPTISTN